MTNNYIVAQLAFNISCPDDMDIGMLLPSLDNFKAEKIDEPIFSLVIDNSLSPSKHRQLMKDSDTGNGVISVYTTDNGDREFIIKDIGGRHCCLLQTNEDYSKCRCALNGTKGMISFGLNDAIMIAYAFAACRHSALLIHASCVCKDGWAYPFIAESGTGKSTHSAKWMNAIEDVQLLNDDNPVLRVIDGIAYVFGSPWSGKTPCYRNKQCQLGALVHIKRDKTNHCEPMRPYIAFANLLSSCSSMTWDKHIHNSVCDTISVILQSTRMYTMHCLPDDQAALICFDTVGRNKE